LLCSRSRKVSSCCECPATPPLAGMLAGGIIANTSTCPAAYPTGAPLAQCGHTAFVELDGTMAYKSALAYVATGDARHAAQAAAILTAWSTKNREFGVKTTNGPLEAAWCVSSSDEVGMWGRGQACHNGQGAPATVAASSMQGAAARLHCLVYAHARTGLALRHRAPACQLLTLEASTHAPPLVAGAARQCPGRWRCCARRGQGSGSRT
jgi:hypothetical protein